jgi:hypothetical protein
VVRDADGAPPAGTASSELVTATRTSTSPPASEGERVSATGALSACSGDGVDCAPDGCVACSATG